MGDKSDEGGPVLGGFMGIAITMLIFGAGLVVVIGAFVLRAA